MMSLVWLYFTMSEHLTVWYGNEHAEMAVFNSRVYGAYAPLFWLMLTCNFVIPFVLLGIRRLRSITTVCISGAAVLLGMWLERFLIIIPSLAHQPLAATWGTYAPTWVEISITAGTFAGMVLLYLIFCKLVPIIAIWEYRDAADHRIS
jgi:molybdopterin-containing oxidoreductase family membrane subunit